MTRSALLWPVKVGIIATALWYFLREPLPTVAAWIVAVVAAILLHLAYASITTGRRREGDLQLLRRAGEPPSDGKRVALVGTLKASGTSLHAPISRTECVGYSYDIFHWVESNRDNATRADRRRVPDFSGVALAPCVIHTPQGNFQLLSYPFLDGFARKTYEDAEHLTRADGYVKQTVFEKTTAFVGELVALDRAMQETEGTLKKDWRMSDADGVSGMTIEEQCIPADAKVCAFGIYSAAKQSLVPDTGSDSRNLLLVAGDAEEGAKRLASGAASSRNVALGAFIPAVAVVVFILFAPWNWLRAAPGGSLIVDKQSARLKDALYQNDLGEIAGALRYLDPNFTFDEASRTPLMLARSRDAGQILLDHGASLTVHDLNGYSVLMNVAQYGSPDLLRLLVSRGANVNERLAASPATSALSLARDRNTPGAADALLKDGARE